MGNVQDSDFLYWKQPRLGLIDTTTIKREGQIVRPNGTNWCTPSGAARHYYQKPIDGWYNQKLERTGERLEEVQKKVMEG